MKYVYYPGCSLLGSAKEYDRASRAAMAALGVDLIELDGWTCCGATAAEAVSRLLSLALPARNLALARTIAPGVDVMVPCSACYLNLKKVEEKTRDHPELLDEINRVLAAEDKSLDGSPPVRHLLDVLVRDVGAGAIAARVTRPLEGLRVAAYYGCQCLRPYPLFDDPERPVSMDPILRAMGAEPFPWELAGRCCGASHMNTKPEAGLKLVTDLLDAARGSDAVVTVCPMCQMNLEAFQGRASRRAGRDLVHTILYLPQLMGLAFGLSEEAVGLNLNLAITPDFRRKLEKTGVESDSKGLAA
jgi:heterodisulfide reductase subunit B